MATSGGPNIIKDGLILNLDGSNIKSFRGEPTTNTINYTGISPIRYNNTGFNGTLINTGQTYKGSPIWEVTFIAQNSTLLPRLGSTDGFGFFHSMGTSLLPNTNYMASVYFKTNHRLQNSASQGFDNTYSNISGWGQGSTLSTRYQEDGWTRLYTRYNNTINIGGTLYSQRGTRNLLNATVNTTQTTQVLVTITVQSNGTYQTTTDFGTNTVGGSITDFNLVAGVYGASPTISSNGGIVGLSTGTSAILQHGLNTSTWTKITSTTPIQKGSFPFIYYLLLNIPSTGGVNATIEYRPNFSTHYTALIDNKYWKLTFDITNVNVNDVLTTYWTAPMIEQHSRNLPSFFTIGTRGTTVATGGGWGDISGNNNHGELINGVGYDSSNLGNLVFDGVDDYIIGNTNLGISGDTEFSICYWAMWNGANFSTDYPSGFGNNTTSIGNSGLSTTWQNGRIALDFWNNRYRANTSLQVQKWYYVCFTKTPGLIGSTTKIYSNSVELSGSVEGTNTSPNIIDSPFVIGRLDSTRLFNGKISNVQVYNRALSAEEILQNYLATKSRYNL